MINSIHDAQTDHLNPTHVPHAHTPHLLTPTPLTSITHSPTTQNNQTTICIHNTIINQKKIYHL